MSNSDSREIKFRAWSGKRMLPGLPVTATKQFRDPAGPNDYITVGGPDYDDGSHWILMQFTGLTDRNGVEIYEGDIVKDSVGQNYDVVFENGSFTKNWPNLWLSNSDEVIGNIYENPELLNPQEDK